MGLILLEALAALALLLGIVWWTMFSGRRSGEPDDAPTALPAPSALTPTAAEKPDTPPNR